MSSVWLLVFMPMAQTEVTQLLLAAQDGTPEVLDRLMPLVYDELRWMAHRQLRSHRASLSTTALVHEAYLKLVGRDELPASSRRHFFGAAANAMRQILIDAARKRQALKRGGDAEHVDLDAERLAVDASADELIALDEALTRLQALDARLAQIVEYRFFGGLTVEETATLMDLSPRTIKRDWRKARAWLYQALRPPA